MPLTGKPIGAVTGSNGDSTSRQACDFFQNLRRELGMKRVTGAVRDQVADHRIADQREIADGVEDLVADELVLEAERVVQDAGLAEHDRVVERAAERQAVLPQHLDVLEERERARRRDFLDERFFGDPQRPRLMPQERVIVADAVGDLEVIRRIERDALVAARDRRSAGRSSGTSAGACSRFTPAS